jgi:hypothetical protein
MAKYEKTEISDLVEGMGGKKVEVNGVARGIQERTSWTGRTGYTAFLENCNGMVLIQGDCDGYVGAMAEISMLRASSETGRKVAVQGKLKGKHPEYKLKVSGVKLGGYEFYFK